MEKGQLIPYHSPTKQQQIQAHIQNQHLKLPVTVPGEGREYRDTGAHLCVCVLDREKVYVYIPMHVSHYLLNTRMTSVFRGETVQSLIWNVGDGVMYCDLLQC